MNSKKELIDKYEWLRETGTKMELTACGLVIFSTIIFRILLHEIPNLFFGLSWGGMLVIIGIIEIILSIYSYKAEYFTYLTKYSHKRHYVTGESAKRSAILGIVMAITGGIFLGGYLIYLALESMPHMG